MSGLFEIPDRDELERRLSVEWSIDERVQYVQQIIRAIQPTANAVANLERDLQREREAKESMAEELRALRIKLGDLSPSERAAAQARYEMMGRMAKARAHVERLEQLLNEEIKKAKESLKTPREVRPT